MSNKRLCRKCGEYIPSSFIIDNKRKILANRKFCLKCSPYKGHNTKIDDPDRPTNNLKKPYKEWNNELKLLHKAKIYKKSFKRKEKLIELAGGACKKCGYNKCNRALSFHHINPEDKRFAVNMGLLGTKSWDVILEEFYKCELLCLNCHAELEQNKADVNSRIYKDILNNIEMNNDIDYINQEQKKEKNKAICFYCKKVFNKKNKSQIYCSVNCKRVGERKVVWPTKEELEQLLHDFGFAAIGKKFGVSAKTVRRWAVHYALLFNQ